LNKLPQALEAIEDEIEKVPNYLLLPTVVLKSEPPSYRPEGAEPPSDIVSVKIALSTTSLQKLLKSRVEGTKALLMREGRTGASRSSIRKRKSNWKCLCIAVSGELSGDLLVVVPCRGTKEN
jgi:hypothetical protein